MKFTIQSTSVDAAYNVTINGVYKDDEGNQVGDERAFQFDLDATPHENQTEFLQACKARIEAAQPVLSAEEAEKLALAEQAKALLDTYVGKDVTLAAPVTE